MKKNDLTIYAFLFLIFFTSTISLGAFFDQKTVSEKENRSLQTIPVLDAKSYLNGSFFKDMETFMYDHYPKRDQILSLLTIYDKARGIQPEIMALDKGPNMTLVNQDGGKETKDASEENRKLREDLAEIDFSEYKTQTQNLSIMLIENKLMELYHFNEVKIHKYLQSLNDFARQMPKGIKMYSLIAPTQIAMTGEKFSDYSDPEDKAIEYLYSNLDDRYKPVNAFDAIYEHKDQYVYFRSDHHWTQLGAYYAANEFAKEAGVNFDKIDKYEKHSFEGFLGFLYNNNQIEKVSDTPDRIDAYVKPGLDYLMKSYVYNDFGDLTSFQNSVINLNVGNNANYRIFLGGDYPIAIYENPKLSTNRKLMIVKDSYANAFIPWLIDSFDAIFIIDPRFFKENIYEFVQQSEITDFLVLDYVISTNLEAYIGLLSELANPKQ